MEKVLVTSALPYCNNIPHLGNIVGSTLSGDVFHRFQQLVGNDSIYVCGTDVHGTAIEIEAKREKMSYQNLCKKYSLEHKKIYDWFNISFTIWGSTNNTKHHKLVQEAFMNLYNYGAIVEKTVEQMFCQKCSIFLPDRYVSGECYHPFCKDKKITTNGDQCDKCLHMIDTTLLLNPKCNFCKYTPIIKNSYHLFLNLKILSDDIKKYNDGIEHDNQVQSIIKSWLDKGLEMRCITRDLEWGVPVPWQTCHKLNKYKNKVFYVWFDALLGYYSILLNSGEYDDWLDPETNIVQFMGKDNVAFHTIILPATIIGSQLKFPLYNKIASTDYLLYEGKKFSKSKKIGLFGNDVIKMSQELGINEDYWRYYLMKIRPEHHDSSFNLDEFCQCVNTDLINNIGNFTNRTILLTKKKQITNLEFRPAYYNVTDIHQIIIDYMDCMESCHFKKATNHILRFGDMGNQYLQTTKPWTLSDQEDILVVLSTSNLLCFIMFKLLLPFIPNTASRILECYNVENGDNIIRNYNFKNNIRIILDTKDYSLPFKKLHS